MKDIYNRLWITEKSLEIIEHYEPGILTLRGLHYRLVANGMTNTTQHYQKVIFAMIKARWDGIVSFETFSDHDRSMLGDTHWERTDVNDKIEDGQRQIKAWMTVYHKNKWENQIYYPEIFIEKKALQGVFEPICDEWNVALGACKGYPSLTFLNDASKRFIDAEMKGKLPIILYFGDYDPSGEDIPRSIKKNLNNLGIEIEVRRIVLMKDQVIKWKLPPAPVKIKDSRTAKWDGLGQVELDAIEPNKLQNLCFDAIENIFDNDLYNELIEIEAEEKLIYKAELKDFVNKL